MFENNAVFYQNNYRQNALLSYLKHSTENKDKCANEVNAFIHDTIGEPKLNNSENLLALHKIAKITSSKLEIWMKLTPFTRLILCQFLPLKTLFSYQETIDVQHAPENGPFYARFSKGSIFYLSFCQKIQHHKIFKIENHHNKTLAFYDPSLFPLNFRESLGATIGHKYWENTKEGWFIVSDKGIYHPLSHWWTHLSPSKEEKADILKKILFLLHQEREFGIRLYNEHSKELFIVLKGTVASAQLNATPISFFHDCKVRHAAFFAKIKQLNEEIFRQLYAMYNQLRTGPFETLLLSLETIFHTTTLLNDENLFSHDSRGIRLAHLLYKFYSCGCEVIPLKRFETLDSLFIYLELAICATQSFEFHQDPYTFAKELILNIPNHTLEKKVNNKAFLDTQEELLAKFTNLCKAIILKKFQHNSLSIEETVREFCELKNFFEPIQKKLNQEAVEQTELQVLPDTDQVSSTGDYLALIFWTHFTKDISDLFEDNYISFEEDPLVNIVYARFLDKAISLKREEAAILLTSALKANYKKTSKEKLAKKLQSRLEKFQTKK